MAKCNYSWLITSARPNRELYSSSDNPLYLIKGNYFEMTMKPIRECFVLRFLKCFRADIVCEP